MRINLLLQREPLGQILEKTLTHFWQDQYGRAYQVQWSAGWPNPAAFSGRHQQTWLCNAYLNAIFDPRADETIFDPIRREFSYSLARWRRPFQKTYVSLALSGYSAPWLAQAYLGVTPAIPCSAQQLIIAGNHKLRVLDYGAQRTYSILKDGFKQEFICRELTARQTASQLGLLTPKLEAIAPDGSWYSEAYLSGTPLNRLADSKVADYATTQAIWALNTLLTQTTQEEGVDDYLTQLEAHIQRLTNASHLLSAQHKQELSRRTKTLTEYIRSLIPAVGPRLLTALTHGDFQPGNILINQEGVWLIDWEYSARRQLGYDALVFNLRSRFPRNLATRLRTFVAAGLAGTRGGLSKNWLGLHGRETRQRTFHAALFMLEELHLHLAENDNPLFTRPGAGLLTLISELALFP